MVSKLNLTMLAAVFSALIGIYYYMIQQPIKADPSPCTTSCGSVSVTLEGVNNNGLVNIAIVRVYTPDGKSFDPNLGAFLREDYRTSTIGPLTAMAGYKIGLIFAANSLYEIDIAAADNTYPRSVDIQAGQTQSVIFHLKKKDGFLSIVARGEGIPTSAITKLADLVVTGENGAKSTGYLEGKVAGSTLTLTGNSSSPTWRLPAGLYTIEAMNIHPEYEIPQDKPNNQNPRIGIQVLEGATQFAEFTFSKKAVASQPVLSSPTATVTPTQSPTALSTANAQAKKSANSSPKTSSVMVAIPTLSPTLTPTALPSSSPIVLAPSPSLTKQTVVNPAKAVGLGLGIFAILIIAGAVVFRLSTKKA